MRRHGGTVEAASDGLGTGQHVHGPPAACARANPVRRVRCRQPAVEQPVAGRARAHRRRQRRRRRDARHDARAPRTDDAPGPRRRPARSRGRRTTSPSWSSWTSECRALRGHEVASRIRRDLGMTDTYHRRAERLRHRRRPAQVAVRRLRQAPRETARSFDAPGDPRGSRATGPGGRLDTRLRVAAAIRLQRGHGKA